ncbi:MAG: hypothetical protein ACE5PO_02145 [Candidatus Bathyarchaeia archaeon]
MEKDYTRDLPQKVDEFTDSSKLHDNLEKRLNVADFIYWKLIGYGHSSECPSLPYGEKHGMCTVFENTFYEELRPTAQNLAQAWHALGLDLPDNVGDLTYGGVQESEAYETFDAWLDSERKRQKILSLVLVSATGTRFESVDFPYEDYSEFLRTRRPLSGVIRRVEEEINKIKLLLAENAGEEAGLLDLQAVIQVMASKSSNREVFYRERPQTKNEAWAILVDTSLSLKSFGTEVRGIAVCLEEVAKSLIRDPSLWGLYAFDSSFRIVKDFREIYTNAIRSRVGGLSYRNKTYLPDAIYVASEILRRIVTDSLKVILVVSDFVAFGYDDIEDQLAQVTKKTRNDGIDLIGVGVNSTPLKKYFNSFCMIEHPYQMLRYFVQAYMSYAAWA